MAAPAWATGRGHGWARVVFAAFFAASTLSLLAALAQGAAVYAPADLIAGATLWLVEFAVVVLLFNRQARPYYSREPAQQEVVVCRPSTAKRVALQ